MEHLTITSPKELNVLCRDLQSAETVGFDTEFVSEDTFHPELCLIQVVTPDVMAVIDPYAVPDLSPFWGALADGDHVTVAHAAREEVNFSLRAIGRIPHSLCDTQIAAGFCSAEYPSSYSAVVSKFLGRRLGKGEQRTDWRRRPLTNAQIDYALEDVRHLLDLHDEIQRRLDRLNRLSWLEEEMGGWLREVDEARSRQRWRRVSGTGNLSARSLAVVRELWRWRQQEAKQRNVPPRRVLRDDLIVELAKRKLDRPEKIVAIRGFQRGGKRRIVDALADCVRRGLDAPLADIHEPSRLRMPSQLSLLGQFLAPALSSICRRANVATSLAGTASDVRDLVAYRLGFGNENDAAVPTLARGWRAELVGNLIDDLLCGRRSIRIQDPQSEQPLQFDEISATPTNCDGAVEAAR